MKPLANLSLDLDNKWAYSRTAGRADWAKPASYLPLVVPRIVEMLGEIGLPLTIFIVGRDLESSHDVQAIKGFETLPKFEFGNHSYNHLPWLHTMEVPQLRAEIEKTNEAIEAKLGYRPVGFRGPGFSCTETVLNVLIAHDFKYDASVFPTSIAPIARAAFLLRSELKGEEREKASKLYGGWNSVMQPNWPYRRTIPTDGHSQSTIWEMPVTVMPLVRTPIHFSYFTYLASFSSLLAKAYFHKACMLLRLTGTSPSLLLHPTDFLGLEDDADMAYFPAMNRSRKEKLGVVKWGLLKFASTFDVKLMIDHVDALSATSTSVGRSEKLD